MQLLQLLLDSIFLKCKRIVIVADVCTVKYR